MKAKKETKKSAKKSAKVEAAGLKTKTRKAAPPKDEKPKPKPKGRKKDPKPYAENFRLEIDIPVLRRFTIIVGKHPKAKATYRALCESIPKATTLQSTGIDPVAIGASIYSHGQIFGHVLGPKEAKAAVAAALSVLTLEDILVISFDKDGTPTAQHPTARQKA